MGPTERSCRHLRYRSAPSVVSVVLVFVVLAFVVAAGGAASASTASTVPDTAAPPDAAPSQPDGSGASVVLRCGSDSTTRLVASFEAPVDAGQQASLYYQTPQSGGFLGTRVEVGDEVPAPPDLVWGIDGVQLGPWPVEEVSDTCDGSGQLAATGPTHLVALASVAGSVVVVGLLLAGPRVRRRRA